MWAVLGVAGVVVVVTGWLPLADAEEVALNRGGPVLGFLVAITILSGLAERAGVFDAAAVRCARLARGSTLRLYLMIAGLGTVVTIGMSLDTTAVLLTPVVLTVTDRLGLRPLPFALLVVWLANTASLLLPVSNLTNLLALQRESLTTLSFAGRMALPEVVAVAITVGYLWLLFRRDLSGQFEIPGPQVVSDRGTFWVCALACIALAPAVLAGVPPWAAAAPAAAAAVLVFLIRDRRHLRWSLLPWRIVILTLGLFLVVTAVAEHGLADLLARLSGDSTLRTVGVSALASNLVNNLPTYLAVEPAVSDPDPRQLLAALVGTNCGPLVLVWGSLASLLWLERCRARGLHIRLRTFALVGLGGVPVLLLGTWAALLVTS